MTRDTHTTEDLVKIGDCGKERLNDREQNKKRDNDLEEEMEMEWGSDRGRVEIKLRETESKITLGNRPGSGSGWIQRPESKDVGRAKEGSEKEGLKKAEVGGCHFTWRNPYRVDAPVCEQVCEQAAGGGEWRPCSTPGLWSLISLAWFSISSSLHK